MENKCWYIKNLDILEGIAPEEIMSLCENVKDETYDSKLMLYTPKDLEQRIFLVKKGEVHLFHTRNGRRFVFDVIGPGGLFGNFNEKELHLSHYAEAMSGTRVCMFPVKEFLKVISKHPEVMMKTLSILSDRIRDYEQKLSLQGADAKQKVLSELRRYQEKKDKPFLGGVFTRGKVKLTHEKLGQLTGLNRVTVTRALQDLSQEGWIEVNKETGEFHF